MRSEAELWAAAPERIQSHGLDAGIFAGMEADAALAAGDLDRLHELRIILRRVRMLLDPARVAPN